jgi:hypothetical protein
MVLDFGGSQVSFGGSIVNREERFGPVPRLTSSDYGASYVIQLMGASIRKEITELRGLEVERCL